MTKGGLFSYLRAYLTNITPYKLFIRLFFVEKQKLVVHPHKNVQRVFFIYIGSFDTPSKALYAVILKRGGNLTIRTALLVVFKVLQLPLVWVVWTWKIFQRSKKDHIL